MDIIRHKNTIYVTAFLAGIILPLILLSILIPQSYGGCSSTCVSSPINEMVTNIQKAQAGIVTSTDAICMNAGERFMDTALTGKVMNLATVTFQCEGSICQHLSLSDNDIYAKSDIKLRFLIDCRKNPDNNYSCTLTAQES